MGNHESKRILDDAIPFQNRKYLDSLFQRKENRAMEFKRYKDGTLYYGELYDGAMNGYGIVFDNQYVIREGIFCSGELVEGAFRVGDKVCYGRCKNRALIGSGLVYTLVDGKEILKEDGQYKNGNITEGTFYDYENKVYYTGAFHSNYHRLTKYYEDGEVLSNGIFGTDFMLQLSTDPKKKTVGFHNGNMLHGLGMRGKECGLFSGGHLVKALDFGSEPHFLQVEYDSKNYQIAGTPGTANVFVGIDNRLIVSGVRNFKTNTELIMWVLFSDKNIRDVLSTSKYSEITDLIAMDTNPSFQQKASPYYEQVCLLKSLLEGEEGETV